MRVEELKMKRKRKKEKKERERERFRMNQDQKREREIRDEPRLEEREREREREIRDEPRLEERERRERKREKGKHNELVPTILKFIIVICIIISIMVRANRWEKNEKET